MPWLRVGDTAANHPTVLAVLEHDDADERLVNETFGFVVRCAAQSTAHLTDYVINRGTAITIAGISRADELLAYAMYAGYLVQEHREIEGARRKVYRIVDDPEFIHMRTKEEIEFERQRKSDNSNPALIVPVRLRDGDACRYCGLVVKFAPGARTGRMVGTYDHREPGKEATVDTYVVACKACNAGRNEDPDADKRYPLLPAPLKPYYSPFTVNWIENNDWAKRNGITAPKTPRKLIEPGQPSGNGTSGRTRQNPQRNGESGAGERSPGSALQSSAESAERPTATAGATGTGRVGTGREGQDRDGSPGTQPPRSNPPAPKRRRHRPRKRKGGTT